MTPFLDLRAQYKTINDDAKQAFARSERAVNEVLSLAMYPELSNNQVEFVSAAVHHHVHAL